MNIVVVLGKRLNDDSTMTKELVERLDLGLKTFKEKNADLLCISGGAPNRKAGVTEASQMYEYLINNNFDEEKIVVEDKSLTTRGNAWYLSRILKGIKIDNMYLVSSKYHFFRTDYKTADFLFKKYFKGVNIINTYNEE